jgi:hypothetical protein
VEGDRKTKTGQENFSTTQDITRNLGKKQCQKKAHAFAQHLAEVFQPHPSENEHKEEEILTQLQRLPTNYNHQSILSKELKFKKSSVVYPKKSSDYDLITGKILKELPIIEIKYLTHLFNALFNSIFICYCHSQIFELCHIFKGYICFLYVTILLFMLVTRQQHILSFLCVYF